MGGGAGSPGGQSRGRKNMDRKEQGQGCRGPGSWLVSSECGDRELPTVGLGTPEAKGKQNLKYGKRLLGEAL